MNAFIVSSPFLSQRRPSNRVVPTCSVTAPKVAAAAAKGPRLASPYKHFLHVDDFTRSELEEVITTAKRIKDEDLLNEPSFQPLLKKAMAMIFAKPSARTRVSFETGMYKTGGHALVLGSEIGLNTREAAKDVSRVLSGMTDVIMARLFEHKDIVELAEYATVPVINGLTDYNHPCQIVADALTVVEARKNLDGAKIVYVGDGNNIVHSWFELAAVLPIEFTCCCPKGFLPDMELFGRAKSMGISDIKINHDPKDAVRGAEFIYSDVWASMGQKEELAERLRAFQGFQINGELMKSTGVDTKFLHCLPAERGRECTDEVMEDASSMVFQQAENRMYAQVAITLKCLDIHVR